MEKGKDLAAMLVAKMPMKKDSMPESTDEGETQEAGRMAASEAMMSALKSDDAKAFADAFKDMIEMCY